MVAWRLTRHLLQARRQEVAGRIEQLRSLADELERLLAAGQAIDSRVCRAEDVCSIIPARP
ncbi:MAG: hypothetical protein R6X29_12805 [Acidimicrobiia bacterium]